MSKKLKLFIKIGIAVFAISFVFSKIDTNQLINTISNSNPIFLLLAFLLSNISKIFASFRLNNLFTSINLFLDKIYNIKLFYVGMFYNTFLPGGIGGDGYKVYLLNKSHNIPIKLLIKAHLIDRLSGLTMLIVLCAISLFFSNFLKIDYIFLLGLFSLIFALPTLYFIYKYFFKEFINNFYKSVFFAFFVQLFELFAVLSILFALNIQTNFSDYFFIFFVSSVVSVLPLSIGGIGMRELTFLYCSQMIGLNVNEAIAISFLFFFICSLMSSFIGLFIKIEN